MENQTDYVRILRTYLETDCSVQETARREFATEMINHRIHQIKETWGRTIGIHDKVELYDGICNPDLKRNKCADWIKRE